MIDPRIAPAAKGDLAWDGANYLVAWTDSRSGTNNDIYGARVSAAGMVQDAAGIALAASAANEGSPAVASGSAGRVALAYERSPSQFSVASQIMLRFFDAGGRSL